MKLHLKKFSELNRNRAVEGFKTYKNVPLTYWTTALMGEGGELCNMIKKMERVANGGIDGGSTYTAASITKEMLKEEIGGIGIYLDLLAGLLGISLEDAIIETFNSKSEKYGFKQFIDESPDELPQDIEKWIEDEVALMQGANGSEWEWCWKQAANAMYQLLLPQLQQKDEAFKTECESYVRLHLAAEKYANELKSQLQQKDEEIKAWINQFNAANFLVKQHEHDLSAFQSQIDELKLQVSARQHRLDGVDKRNYELLEYSEKQAAEIESLKAENMRRLKLLDLAQAELRAMYGRCGFHGSNVLDLIDKEVDESLKQQQTQ